MTLVVLQVIVQSIASTLQWLGFYVGIRALPDDKSRRWRWIVGSALVFAAWLIGVALLAAAGFFPSTRIPAALACPIHQGNANFEVWRNFPSPAATIRGAACSARFDFIFIG